MAEPTTLRRPPLPTRDDVIHSDPEIMSGTPVFRGTRVPADTLFHYLSHGKNIAAFRDDFPSVSEEQATQLLDAVGRELMKVE